MCMIGTLEADDSESRINTNSMVCNISCSLAKECKRLCEDEIRINGVKSHRKLKKTKTIKIVKNIYHLQDKDDVKEEVIGFKKGNRNGISFMYNIRCTLNLCVGKADIRRIPCA